MQVKPTRPVPRPLGRLAQLTLLGAAALALVIPPGPAPTAYTASHREAPAISLDGPADITDFFMFRSYETGKAGNVVLMMDVMSEEPSSGPNYWNFDPKVRYAFHVDNNADGRADDVVFEFEFRTEIRGAVADLNLFLSYLGNIPGAVPPITALDGPGSEGLGLRQKYSVTMVRNGVRIPLGSDFIAVPSNVGPKTMPSYPALASQGIYSLGNGIRVFAGQRQDPFYIDLGGVFDTLNLRRNLPLLTMAEDANDNANAFGVDMLSGFNVSTIALEVPAALLTVDGKSPGQTAYPKLGGYASTSRRRLTVLRGTEPPDTSGAFVQVQRLANPLINETIIPTELKDRWNGLSPQQESEFVSYYTDPTLALSLELVYGVPADKTGRNDLVDLLLKYQPSDTTLSELLRLDVSVMPTPLASQKRLGPLAHNASGGSTPDMAAWPNGRRPKDDVTDVAIRVVGGTNYTNALAGDGINVDDAVLSSAFPFLATPADGRNRIHANP